MMKQCGHALVTLFITAVTSKDANTGFSPVIPHQRRCCFMTCTTTSSSPIAIRRRWTHQVAPARPDLTTRNDVFHHHYRRIIRELSLSSSSLPPSSSVGWFPSWARLSSLTVLRWPCSRCGGTSMGTRSRSSTRRSGGRGRGESTSTRSIPANMMSAVIEGATATAAGGGDEARIETAAEWAAGAGAGGQPPNIEIWRSHGDPACSPAVVDEKRGEPRGGRGLASEETASRSKLGKLSQRIAAAKSSFANARQRKNSRGSEKDETVDGLRGVAAGETKLEIDEVWEEESLQVVPQHVAFVMDGNGRWAADRNMPRRAGHVEGARRAGEAVETCRQLGIEFVTLYAFSTENWNRPAGEVSFLMDLMEKTLLEQRDGLRKNGIRLTAIGELDRLPGRLRSLLLDIQEDSEGSWDGIGTMSTNKSDSYGSSDGADGSRDGSGKMENVFSGTGVSEERSSTPLMVEPGGPDEEEGRFGGAAERTGRWEEVGAGDATLPHFEKTASGGSCKGDGSDGGELLTPTPNAMPTMTLCLAISYGGRSELANAARELAVEAAAGRLDPNSIDESTLGRRLSTARLGIPDPDLVVRTSGERRLSNLLVWQSAYSELHVVGKAWPEFRRSDLVEALRDYGRRRRRFGKTPEQIAET